MQCLPSRKFPKLSKKSRKAKKQEPLQSICSSENDRKIAAGSHQKEGDQVLSNFRKAKNTFQTDALPTKYATIYPHFEEPIPKDIDLVDTLDRNIQRHERQDRSHDKTSITNFDSLLKDERRRLQTFVNYPQEAVKSALVLANNGFIYIENCSNEVESCSGEGESFICIFCGARKTFWEWQDDVEQVHRTLSPECPLLSGDNSENISFYSNKGSDIKFDFILQKLTPPTHLIELDSAPSAQEESYRSLASNGNTFSKNYSPLSLETSSILTSTTEAVEGNSHLLDLVQNGTSFSTTRFDDSPQVSSQTEAISALPLQAPVNLAQSSIGQTQDLLLERPLNDDYLHVSTQVAPSAAISATSATSTPSSSSQSPSNTVNSNTGSQPATTANNRQGLTNQPRQRNPTYSELGIITERPKRTEYALPSERIKSFSSWPRGHFLEPTDLANAGFYYGGYGDCARCFYCGGGLKNWEDEDDVLVEHARWFPKCAYIRNKMGQAFVDAVKVLNESHDKITFQMVTDKMGGQTSTGQLDPKDNDLRRDPAVKTMIDLGYNEIDSLEIAQNLKDRDLTLTADVLLETLKQEGKTANRNISNIEQKTSQEEDLEMVRQLKEKNLHLRQQTVCKMCLDNEVSVVFLPCGHLVSCSECSSAVSKCPMCRADVKGIVRAFLS